MPGLSRRAPYPYDVNISSEGYMVGKTAEESGPPVVEPIRKKKPETLERVAPTAFDYSAMPPDVEAIEACEDMSGGMGLKVQEKRDGKRYHYALNLDTSLGRPWLMGPRLRTSTPAAKDGTHGITDFLELKKGSTRTLYAVNGKYLQERAAGSAGDHATSGWALNKDLTTLGTAGSYVRDACRFVKPAQTQEAAYLAMGDSEAILKFEPGIVADTWTRSTEEQTIIIRGTPTGGHWHLDYHPIISGELAYDISAAALQTALRAIAGLEAVTVTKDGTAPTVTYVVKFEGVTGNASLLVATDSLTLAVNPAITINTTVPGVVLPEIQTIQYTASGGTPSGHWHLESGGRTSAPIYVVATDTATTVRTKIDQALLSMGYGWWPGPLITLSGTAPDFLITVTLPEHLGNLAQMTSVVGDLTNLAITHGTLQDYTRTVEQQTVVITGSPLGGNYRLKLNFGTVFNSWTSWLEYDATGDEVQAALRTATSAGITVSTAGTSPNFTHTISFNDSYIDPPQLVVEHTLDSLLIEIETTNETLMATAIGVAGSEFWRAHDVNEMSKCDTSSDPFDSSEWGADFTIGDHGSAINRLLVTLMGSLVVTKTDGLYTLDAEGNTLPLSTDLRNSPAADAGKGWGAWLNDVLIPFGTGLLVLSPDFTRRDIGPETLLVNNDSPVRGYITATAAHGTYHAYAAIWNPDTNKTYLLKLVRGDTWHGSITKELTSLKVLCMRKSTVGAPADHSRMYMGMSDGTVRWFNLPCTSNPAACTQYEFAYSTDATEDGYLYMPVWTGGYGNNPKALRAVTVTGTDLAATKTAKVSYDIFGGAGLVTLANVYDTYPREQGLFPDTATCYHAQFRFDLHNEAANDSPEVTGVGIHYRVRPESQRMIYQLLILVADRLTKRNGAPVLEGAGTLRDRLLVATDTDGPVAVILPDEVSKQMSLTYIGETQAWNPLIGEWQAAIEVEALEISTNA